jgi:hypothetical protein
MAEAQFWFNTRTQSVETDSDRGQSKDLLGPFPSQEAAEQALASAARRTHDWDEDDRKWKDGDGSGPAPG